MPQIQETQSTFFALKSFAKINLFLSVQGKRADGYHDLVSLVQAIDLHDTLEFSPLPSGIIVKTDQPELQSSEDNSIYKALQKLSREYGITFGIQVKLTKRIPLASGLGGGSSNAATALWGGSRHWGLAQPVAELSRMGAEIGSDVPFFFSSGQAVLRGRGEVVEPVPLFADYWVVVVYPGFGIGTRWAYQELDFSRHESVHPGLTPVPGGGYLSNLETKEGFVALLSGFANDFEPAVARAYPVIGQIKQAFVDSGAVFSSVTGSGSALFGIFLDQPVEQEITRRLQVLSEYRKPNPWQVIVTRPVIAAGPVCASPG